MRHKGAVGHTEEQSREIVVQLVRSFLIEGAEQGRHQIMDVLERESAHATNDCERRLVDFATLEGDQQQEAQELRLLFERGRSGFQQRSGTSRRIVGKVVAHLQRVEPAQRSDQFGCISDTRTGGQCVDGTALDFTALLGFSPDGGNLYVSALNSGAIAIFGCGSCGDGILGANETCDDGNLSNNDSCPNTCATATCGDGFLCSDAGTCTSGPGGGVEACDDGNASNDDACLTTCQLADEDDDGDGVTNRVENDAPNGGDGDGDGVLDSLQSNATSLPDATDGSYETLLTDASCPHKNVKAVPLMPAGFTLPFGALSFELPGCPSTKVTVYYHGTNNLASPPFQYVKQGPNPPGAANNEVYTLATGAPHNLLLGTAALPFDPAVGVAMFNLEDGTVGDDTGEGDGIFDPGGPGLPLSKPVPTLSWKALAVAVIALSCVVWIDLRRRRT